MGGPTCCRGPDGTAVMRSRRVATKPDMPARTGPGPELPPRLNKHQ
jgi:hypothetical protein